MNFSIEKKMAIGYLPIILIIVVIAIFSGRSLNKLNAINKSIIDEDTFLVQTSERMMDTILAQESYGRRYLILDSRQMLDLFQQRSREFDELADKVRTLPHRQGIPIEKLIVVHNQFNALYTKPDAVINYDSAVLTDEFDHQVKNKFDLMMELLQKMIQIGKKNQYIKMRDANSLGIQSFQLTVLLSTLGIILGLAAASFITRNISRTISQLKRATEIISEGRYDHNPQIDTKDELADLAASLQLMAQSLSLLEKISLDSNPLTRMPGGLAIETVLIKRLEINADLAFCMLDLDNFKSYNDRYGYAQGNEVIKTTAAIIKSAVAKHGAKDDFIGHIGGDDFAIVTDIRNYDTICNAIIKRFNEDIAEFYNEIDRKRGHIVAKSRQGQLMQFPIMSISIAVVTNEEDSRMNHIKIGEIAAELKEYAKSIPGSVYVTNRRGRKNYTTADNQTTHEVTY